MIRTMKRHIAKVRMQRRGMRHICKHGKGQRSFFADNWREYVK